MRKGFLTVCLFFVVGLLLGQSTRFVPNRVVVKFSSNSLKSTSVDQLVNGVISKSTENYTYKPMFPSKKATLKSTVPVKYDLSNIYLIDVEESDDIFDLINDLKNNDAVIYAQPYYIPELLGTSNDTYVGAQYYVNLVKSIEAHDIHPGDTNVVVGIVDTGVDIYHEDLVDTYKYNYDDPVNGIDDDLDGYVDNFRGWDLAMNDNNPQSLISHHGTLVAGMASTTNNNGKGLYGVGGNVKLLPIKVMNTSGVLIAAYEGIVYAADQGCQIINCSWGSQIKNPLCDDVVAYATEYKNALVVAAAGNNKTDQPYYPASCKGVLNVGGTNSLDVKWNNSTYGIEVDICAPGEAVLTTNQGDNYSYGYGTSFASPLVAGAAGLLKSYKPDYTPRQLYEQLRISSDVIDTLPDNLFYNGVMGYGRLNALRALTADTLPSVRIDDLQVNQKVHAGETDTIELTTYLTNYLAPIGSATIRLTNEDEYVDILDGFYVTGSLNTLQSKNNVGSPFRILVADDAPYDYTIRNTFEIKGSNYDDYQTFDLLINPSFLDVEPNKLATSFTSNGKIAYANQEKRIGKGMLYNGAHSILNEGGIILATSADNMVNALFSEYDFEIVKLVETSTANSDYLESKAIYAPKDGLSNLVVEITEKNKAWYTGDFSSTIFYNYEIVNKGSADIQDMIMSVFTDWDLVSSIANQVAFDDDLNLVYTYTNLTQNMYAGICLLNQDDALPHTFDIIDGGNGGLDIIEDFSDQEKWFAMTNSRTVAGTEGDTINVASMLSTRVFNIESGDTAVVNYALILAENLGTLKDKARKAHNLFYVPPVTTGLITEAVKDLLVYPNPAKNNIYLDFNGEYCSGQINLMDQTGKVVYSDTFTNKHSLSLSVNINDGLYYLSIANKQGITSRKISILN